MSNIKIVRFHCKPVILFQNKQLIIHCRQFSAGIKATCVFKKLIIIIIIMPDGSTHYKIQCHEHTIQNKENIRHKC